MLSRSAFSKFSCYSPFPFPVDTRFSQFQTKNAPFFLQFQCFAVKFQAKYALGGHFAFALAAYPLIMGATLAGRGSWMSLINPRPVPAGTPPGEAPPGPDLWVTDDALTLVATGFAFSSVLVAHFNLLAHLSMRRPTGVARMGKGYSAGSASSLVLITITYFLYYMRSSRYGVKSSEWAIFYTSTVLMLVISVILVLCPCKQQRVVKALP